MTTILQHFKTGSLQDHVIETMLGEKIIESKNTQKFISKILVSRRSSFN